LQQDLETSQNLLASLKRKCSEAEDAKANIEKEHIAMKAKLHELESLLHERDDQIIRLNNDKDGVFDELSMLRSKVSLSQTEISFINATRDKDAALLSDARAEIGELNGQIMALKQELGSLSATAGAGQSKIRSLLSDLEVRERNIIDLEQKLSNSNKALHEAVTKNQDLLQDITEFKGKISRMEITFDEQKREIDFLRNQLTSSNKDSTVKQREAAALVEELDQKRSEVKRLEAKLSESERAVSRSHLTLNEVSAAENAMLITIRAFLAANSYSTDTSHLSVGHGKVVGLLTNNPGDAFEDLSSPPAPSLMTDGARPTHEMATRPDGRSLQMDEAKPIYSPGAPHFRGLVAALNNLQEYVIFYRSRCTGLEAAIGVTNSQLRDYEATNKALQARSSEQLNELERLRSGLSIAQAELSKVNSDAADLSHECVELRKFRENSLHQLRGVKRQIQGILSIEDLYRARVAMESVGKELSVNAAGQASSSSNALVAVNKYDSFAEGENILPIVEDLRVMVTKYGSVIDQLAQELGVQYREARQTEKRSIDKEMNWEQERKGLVSKLESLNKAYDAERTTTDECRSLLQRVADELDRQRAENEKRALLVEDLENKLRLSNNSSEDLQGMLQDTEHILEEVRRELSKEKELTQELNGTIEKYQADQISSRQKLASVSLMLEEKTYEYDRLLASQESAADLRKALEAELERTRKDLDIASRQASHSHLELSSHVGESKASYEAERLLAALSATLEQMNLGHSTSINMSVSTIDNASIHSGMSQIQVTGPLSTRVDVAIKRLTDMRAWVREDKRTQRQQTALIADLERDLAQLRSTSMDRIAHLTGALEVTRGREIDLQESVSTTVEKDTVIQQLRNEVAKLKQDIQSYHRSNSISDAGHESKSKDLDFTRLNKELQERARDLDLLRNNLRSLEETNSSLTSAIAERDEQLRISRITSTRLSENISRLEQVVEKYKVDIDALQKRVLGSITSLGGSEVGVAELKAELKRAQEMHIAYARDMEERRALLVADVEEYKRKVHFLEEKVQIHVQGAENAREEITSLRRELHKAQSRIQLETSELSKSKTKLEYLRQSEEEWKLQLDAASSMLEDMEQRLRVSEAEGDRLRQQLASYQDRRFDDTQAKLAKEIEDKKALEIEASQLSQSLETCQKELAASNARTSALRAEGKYVRKCVLEIADQIRGAVSNLQAELPQTLAYVPDKAASGSLTLAVSLGIVPENIDSRMEESKVESAKHIYELTKALEDIRGMSSWVISVPLLSSRAGLEGKIQKLEHENARLRRDADNTLALHEDRCRRLQTEVETLENLLRDVRQKESSRVSEYERLNNELEQSLQKDRDAMRRLDLENSNLRKKVSDLQSEAARLREELLANSVNVAKITEVDGLRATVKELRDEVVGVTRHRNSLQEALLKLESVLDRNFQAGGLSDISMNTSQLLDMSTGDASIKLSQGLNQEGILQLQRQVSKYRTRSRVLEDVSDIYRNALMNSVGGGESSEGIPALLEARITSRLVDAVRKGYEDAIASQNEQIDGYLGVIRQNNSYMNELRTRLEETLRAMYRSTRDSPGAGVSEVAAQQQHIQVLMQNSRQIQDKYDRAISELAAERRAGHGKYEALVNELKNLSEIVERCEIDARSSKEMLRESESKFRSEAEVFNFSVSYE
jgi:chromosome segregation ATPase/uncharacterized protein YdbL (DUF1318 family)